MMVKTIFQIDFTTIECFSFYKLEDVYLRSFIYSPIQSFLTGTSFFNRGGFECGDSFAILFFDISQIEGLTENSGSPTGLSLML